MKTDENLETIYLRRIAEATERTARYTRILAIPIFLALAWLIIAFIVALLGYFSIPARP